MKTMEKMLGEKLKTIRIQKGMSQQYVADRLSLSRPAIANYENAVRSIDIVTLCKMCDIYGVEVNDIISEMKKYVYKK